jgi:dihydroorotate dehydrogenase
MKSTTLRLLYKNALRPILFLFDAESVHNVFSRLSRLVSAHSVPLKIAEWVFSYRSSLLGRKIDGIKFANPVGLAAGFDYNGDFAKTMKYVGFGFNTVGTVTAKSYEGNKKPRLVRLPKSKSILVNKGFKSLGAGAVLAWLNSLDISETTLGISVGSSNLPEIASVKSAVEDYIYTFNKFKNKEYVKYFELNISCPNLGMKESFSSARNFETLLKAVSKLNIKKPIYVKMPNEVSFQEIEALCKLTVDYKMQGVILSNLVKKRDNKYLDRDDISKVKKLKGNFSGKPCNEQAVKLVGHVSKKYGDELTIIGCGGVFDAADAKEMSAAGADLVQLITGMVFEGPQLAGDICRGLVEQAEDSAF